MALILVLIVIALLLVMVLEVAVQARIDLRRVENQRAWWNANELATSGIDAAKLLLQRDLAETRTDHPGELWAQPLGPLSVGAGEATVRLSSADGRLNLNNIVGRDGSVDEEFAIILSALYAGLGLTPGLVDALIDWIDPDEQPRGMGGAETSFYSGLTPPFETKNDWLDAVDELRAIRGYDADTVALLSPFVVVLPPPALLNVNTAPPRVLAAINPRLNTAELDEIVAVRTEAPFATVQALLQLPGRAHQRWPVRWLTTVSRYFEVEATARIGRALVTRRVLLDRGTRPMRTLLQG